MTVKKINKINASIAIIGRPNVGKSTLFNRLIGEKKAVIAEEAGTTRDRVEHILEMGGYKIGLIDTGGLRKGKKNDLEEGVERQAKIGIENADVILFMINAIEEITSEDLLIAQLLRKSKKKVILVASKCDNQKIEGNIYEIYRLGFGEPIPVSAIHKIGMDELEEEIVKALKKLKIKKTLKREENKNKIKDSLKISILGRPNVGKSSLLNSLLGEERVVVSVIPGTTRDPTDTDIEYNDRKITIIDTAGIRRKGRIERGIEHFSFLRTQETIHRSDISIILMDASEPATSQDLHVINLALQEKTGIIIAVNKADLVEKKGDEMKNQILNILRYKCDFLSWAPVVFVSAKNKKNIYKLLDLALEISEVRKTEISTSKLNTFFQKTIMKAVPASTGIYKSKFFYANQIGKNPPKFIFFFRNAKYLHFSYKRYLENEMRKEFDFTGTPISLTFRETPSKR